MNAAEIVIHIVQADRCGMVRKFFAESVCEARERRIGIRIVRFWRSTKLVEMWSRSGSPHMILVSIPMHCAGLRIGLDSTGSQFKLSHYPKTASKPPWHGPMAS